jgi:hypothetical protein
LRVFFVFFVFAFGGSDAGGRFDFMLLLLLQLDRLGLVIAELHLERVALGRDAEVAIAELTHEIERLPRRLLQCKAPCIVRHVALDRLPHVRRGAEVAIGRNQPVQCLVRPLEVIAMHPQFEAALAVGEVGEDRPRKKLRPESLPEALHLPQRLRVLRPALHVRHAVPLQRHLELGHPAPRRVLPPLIGQHLVRTTVRRHPALERLQHQHRLLVVRHRVRHHEARVVIQEHRHVDPLVPSQQEREDIRLPQLIRLRPLEPPLRLRSSHTRRSTRDQTRLVEDAANVLLRHADRFETPQQIADPPCPCLRMRLLRLEDRPVMRLRFGVSFLLPLRTRTRSRILERLDAT